MNPKSCWGGSPTSYIVRDEEGEGYWEIVIEDVKMKNLRYTEPWGYVSFWKTVTCTYNDSGNSSIAKMSAYFVGKIDSGTGAKIYSVSNGSFTSAVYNANVSPVYNVLQGSSTSTTPAHAQYVQGCIKNTGEGSVSISLHLYLTSTGSATVVITIS